jgi:NifB/MoaA-like Fe-S oxidoreductase
MMRLLITEFEEALAEYWVQGSGCRVHGTGGFSVATGVASCKYLTNLLKTAKEKYDTISGRVYAVRNDFFGDSVTVSGLVTGGDIIKQLSGRDLGSRLLIPQNMLRHGDDVFLDDVTVQDVSKALGVPVRTVKQDGADLLSAFIGG